MLFSHSSDDFKYFSIKCYDWFINHLHFESINCYLGIVGYYKFINCLDIKQGFISCFIVNCGFHDYFIQECRFIDDYYTLVDALWSIGYDDNYYVILIDPD